MALQLQFETSSWELEFHEQFSHALSLLVVGGSKKLANFFCCKFLMLTWNSRSLTQVNTYLIKQTNETYITQQLIVDLAH